MKTEIFESYMAFYQREDKSLNGVSKEFAELHPDYEKQNETNDGCWNCSGCSGCSGCSDSSDCSDCSRCSRCSRCSYLTNARPVEQSENNPVMVVPIIENIHQKVFEAVTATDDSLNMDTWHTCETTHCRAGWVVQLAGEEGKKLELQTSTLFAAQQIYFKSSPKINVSPTRFYESNEVALKDMERCAKEEIELTKN